MAARIEAAPVRDQIRFVVAGDSGAWPDPTADGICAQLLDQVAALDPPPLFFANLGDFAGPGTPERHEHYLRLAERLCVPNICVIGNHDLDDPAGPDAFERFHGPTNFDFGHGHTRLVVLHAEPGVVGEIEVRGSEGPREEDLAFLDERLRAASEPNRVVLMHMPPHLGGHFAPHADWGFEQREAEFLGPAARASRLPRLLRARARLRYDRPRRRPLRHVGRWRYRPLLALPRRLHAGRRNAREPGRALPRCRARDRRGPPCRRPDPAGYADAPVQVF